MTIVRVFESQHAFGTPDGYGLLKQLKNEFAILTRTEGYYFRQLILNYRVSRASKLDSKEIVQASESEFYSYDSIVFGKQSRIQRSWSKQSRIQRSWRVVPAGFGEVSLVVAKC